MNENLINELRDCADQLTKLANIEEPVKVASAPQQVSTERSEYMKSVMEALGLEGETKAE